MEDLAWDPANIFARRERRPPEKFVAKPASIREGGDFVKGKDPAKGSHGETRNVAEPGKRRRLRKVGDAPERKIGELETDIVEPSTKGEEILGRRVKVCLTQCKICSA